jgi:nucleoid-associated protein YgaU
MLYRIVGIGAAAALGASSALFHWVYNGWPDVRTAIPSSWASSPTRSLEPTATLFHPPSSSTLASGDGTDPSPPVFPVGSTSKATDPTVALLSVATPTETSETAIDRPGFDVVRVETNGETVIAGHSNPKAIIQLRDGESVVATVAADDQGQFVILPGALSPGSHTLTLAARDAAAGVVLSKAIAIEVGVAPENAAFTTANSSAPTRSGAAEEPTAAAQAITLDASAPPAKAVATERNVIMPEIVTATVARGDSLWLLSRRYYKDGARYHQIFAANATQIRSPGLIYPGQSFVVPPAAQ